MMWCSTYFLWFILLAVSLLAFLAHRYKNSLPQNRYSILSYLEFKSTSSILFVDFHKDVGMEARGEMLEVYSFFFFICFNGYIEWNKWKLSRKNTKSVWNYRKNQSESLHGKEKKRRIPVKASPVVEVVHPPGFMWY